MKTDKQTMAKVDLIFADLAEQGLVEINESDKKAVRLTQKGIRYVASVHDDKPQLFYLILLYANAANIVYEKVEEI